MTTVVLKHEFDPHTADDAVTDAEMPPPGVVPANLRPRAGGPEFTLWKG